MKTEVEQIRAFIRSDEIEKALEIASHISQDEISDTLILIANRYRKWKREKVIGMGDNSVERHSIINSFLEVIAELERKVIYSKQDIFTNAPIIDDQNPTIQEIGKQQNLIQDGKPQVFISYSHKDKKYLEDFRRYFKPLNNKINFWDDTKIEAGQKWEAQIKQQIQKATIVILLISTDFFNSDFIVNNELPPLLKLVENEGAKVLPVILKPCLWEEYPQINQYQAVNDPAKPISSMSKTEREFLWINLVRIIKNVIEQKL